MDNVDCVALLSQEAAERTLLVKKAAEEGDGSQTHAYREGRIPESIYRRPPGPVTELGDLL